MERLRISPSATQLADRASEPGTRCAQDAQAGDVPLETLLEESDIITLHCPLTVQTRDRIDATACARMKRWLLPINTARGGPVNEAALVDAAQCGDCALSAKRGNRIGVASA